MPVHIYARVRPMLPFEAGQKNIISSKGADLTVSPPNAAPKTFTFSAISGQSSTNEDCFELIAKPMCESVLEGYNAVLMAYGQTGCGKTFTMLGKPAINVVGLIPRAMDYLLNQPGAPGLELSVVEAYSRNVMKIEIFDLLDTKNVCSWDKKKGSTTKDNKDAISIVLKSGEHGRQLILQAQSAGHYAPTGKNPESSRGHTCFLLKTIPDKSSDELVDPSTFVFVDLAGSEGETALTPEFCATHTQEEVLMRRMEGGVINNGLSAIQSIFRELGKSGKVAKIGRTGVRRILLEFINKNTAMSVMFMLSPAEFNSAPTISTLYFAKSASLIKIKPKKKAKRVNWEKVAEVQKIQIDDLNTQIAELTTKIQQYSEDPELLAKLRANFKAGDVADIRPMRASMGDRQLQLDAVFNGLDEEIDESKEVGNELLFEEKAERSAEEIMQIEDLEELTPPELLIRVQGLEFLLESERSLRTENERNKDLFIEYLTDGMNSLRKKMRKLAKAHELLKRKHGD